MGFRDPGKGFQRIVKVGEDKFGRSLKAQFGGSLGVTGATGGPHGVGERDNLAYSRFVQGLLEEEVFWVDLSKGHGRVRVQCRDGCDSIAGGPTLCVQVLQRPHAGATDSAQRVGGAVWEVSESLAGGDGVEDSPEQVSSEKVGRVMGQPGGILLDSIGPLGRRVGVDPLADVFPDEIGEAGFVMFENESEDVAQWRVGWRADAAEFLEKCKAPRNVSSDAHRPWLAPSTGKVASAEERGNVAVCGVAEWLGEAPSLGRKTALVPGQQSSFQHPATQDRLYLAPEWCRHQKESLRKAEG